MVRESFVDTCPMYYKDRSSMNTRTCSCQIVNNLYYSNSMLVVLIKCIRIHDTSFISFFNIITNHEIYHLNLSRRKSSSVNFTLDTLLFSVCNFLFFLFLSNSLQKVYFLLVLICRYPLLVSRYEFLNFLEVLKTLRLMFKPLFLSPD